MATVIKAGNATTGASITPDATGTLDFKTGAGAGATAMSIDASQVVSFPGTLVVPGTFSPTNISTAGTLASGAATITGNSSVTGDLTVTGALTASSITTPTIAPITASVAASALTVTLNATAISFRSSTLSSGTVNTRTVPSPISVVVSSGSTLGTISGQQSRIIVLAIDNAGTVELAVVNMAGGNNLDETTLISTTAEGGAGGADSASTIYSTTARTNVPFRVVGFIQSTQTTAGTWATAPSTIQGAGGNAVTAMSSIGYGQTWQLVNRSSGATYYNTTGKPILFCFVADIAGGGTNMTVNSFAFNAIPLVLGATLSLIIPTNASYSITTSATGVTYELR